MSSSEETTAVENWAEYSDALVDRGRLTIWISEEAIQDWKADREPQQGAQWVFTDGAIETCLQIKMVYGLTLRETEGFVESLFALFAFRTFGTGGAAGSRLHDSFEAARRSGYRSSDLFEKLPDAPGTRLDWSQSLRRRGVETAHPRKTKAAHLAETPPRRR